MDSDVAKQFDNALFRLLFAECSRLCDLDTACGFLTGGGFIDLFKEVDLFVNADAIFRMELVEESRTENDDEDEVSLQWERRRGRCAETSCLYAAMPSVLQVILTRSFETLGAVMFLD